MSRKFTVEQIASLIVMQDDLNSVLNPNWKSMRWHWNLAIRDELIELANHLGYKWWKSGYQARITDENRTQLQLEVIDVIHFDISKLTAKAANMTAEEITERYNLDVPAKLQTKSGYELVTLARVMDNKLNALLIPQLMEMTGLTAEVVMEVYTKKWVLNKFRWNNGYADGTYQKMWLQEDGSYLEDNQVLENIADRYELDPSALYSILEDEYDAHLVRSRRGEETVEVPEEGLGK